MKKEIKIQKWVGTDCSYHIMETELGPHGKEYTTYRRNNDEDWQVLMDTQFVQLGRRSEKQLETLFKNYYKGV
jgi:hypothetical protein